MPPRDVWTTLRRTGCTPSKWDCKHIAIVPSINVNFRIQDSVAKLLRYSQQWDFNTANLLLKVSQKKTENWSILDEVMTKSVGFLWTTHYTTTLTY